MVKSTVLSSLYIVSAIKRVAIEPSGFEPALFGIRFAEPPGIAEPVITPTISCAKRSFSLLYFEISMSVFAS